MLHNLRRTVYSKSKAIGTKTYGAVTNENESHKNPKATDSILKAQNITLKTCKIKDHAHEQVEKKLLVRTRVKSNSMDSEKEERKKQK